MNQTAAQKSTGTKNAMPRTKKAIGGIGCDTYEDAMSNIEMTESEIATTGALPFEQVMEKAMDEGKNVSVEDLFHLIVNDVRRIYCNS
jgi:hypothetical protein